MMEPNFLTKTSVKRPTSIKRPHATELPEVAEYFPHY